MAQVVLEGVEKAFPGGVRAVRNLSLDIPHGRLTVLVGPSGCGKTTTLRLIAGLERADAGTISIGGRAVDDLPPRRRNVAMVFQDHALYPHLSVARNLAFGLKMRRVPPREISARLEQVAQWLGLAGLLDRRPHTLSGGQQQRVALGRAIVRRPDVFLLDEPLASLDKPQRDRLRGEIVRLQRRSAATMLYVTHDQVEAMTAGDRIAVVCDGGLQQVGDSQTLYRRPANRFVAGFLGDPPINFLEGTIRAHQGRLRFVARRGWAFPMAVAHAGGLAPYVDRPVVLGLRPESLRPAHGSSPPDGPRLSGRLENVEIVGPTTRIFLRCDEATIVCRTENPWQPAADGRVTVRFDAGEAHFFDSASGKAIG